MSLTSGTRMNDKYETQPLPTFLVIGAHRAGTTTLHYDLLKHPDVVMSTRKEPNFFVFDGDAPDLPLERATLDRIKNTSVVDPVAYQQLFQGSTEARAVGEVSPFYLLSRQAAQRIKDTLPDARIVAILRNPIDRAYSAYIHRAGADPDTAAFVETAEREYVEFKRGTPLPRYPLIPGGLYSVHLESYLELFSPSQIMINVYESFWPNYSSALGTIHEFVGVRPLPPPSDHRLNKSGVPRFSGLESLLRGSAPLRDMAKRHLPSGLVGVLGRTKLMIEGWALHDAPELGDAARSYLFDRYFAADIERVEHMLHQDLSIWRH